MQQQKQHHRTRILSPPCSPAPLPFSMRIITIDHYMAQPLPQMVPSPLPFLTLDPPQPSPHSSGLRVCPASRQSNPASSRHASLRCDSERPKGVHARAPRVPLLARASGSCGRGGRVGCLRQQVSGRVQAEHRMHPALPLMPPSFPLTHRLAALLSLVWSTSARPLWLQRTRCVHQPLRAWALPGPGRPADGSMCFQASWSGARSSMATARTKRYSFECQCSARHTSHATPRDNVYSATCFVLTT
jgi:hypothetical protein